MFYWRRLLMKRESRFSVYGQGLHSKSCWDPVAMTAPGDGERAEEGGHKVNADMWSSQMAIFCW